MTIPTVHFGMLEDMLAEIQEGIQVGKTFQGIRVGAHSRTRITLGEEKTVALIVATSLMTDTRPGGCAQYNLWVWHIGSYSPTREHEANAWTRLELDTLVKHLLRAVNHTIEQERGTPPKAGMYSVDPQWFDTSGGTRLIDLPLYRDLIKPPPGIHVVPVTTGHTLVLGSLSDGSFQEAPDSRLTSDDRIRLVSPDLTSTWLRLPVGYERAVAAKEEHADTAPCYTIIYGPESSPREREPGGVSARKNGAAG
jgi:hypothetical protein